jgi:CheY-like chemotaxis protein
MAPAKVLVVDDNEAIRMSLCAILEKHGFDVTCAANVSEALRFIASVARPVWTIS